jgi:hypothetical protein
MKGTFGLAAILAMSTLFAGQVPVSANARLITTVAQGLDHPRGIVLANGGLVVAEAGHAGPFCSFGVPLIPDGTCIGSSGRISWLDPSNGSRRVLVSGLFSVFDPIANGALGIDGLSRRDGQIVGILAAAPQWFPGFPCSTSDCQETLDLANRESGRLITVSPSGELTFIASVGDYNFNWTSLNPTPPDEPDTNPYGVLAVDGGAYVADAASNLVDFVSNSGQITVVQHFFKNDPQSYPVDAVPTCVARTGRTIWISDLSGRLFRLQDGHVVQVPLPLIHHVTGCAADENGNLYLVNMWSNAGRPTANSGSVVRYRVEDGSARTVASGLNFPNMLAVGSEGAVYVSANSICGPETTSAVCSGGGKILRISQGDGDR